jgi:predicted membrane channel-forming protein YqfA (hemolysin III family)
VTIIENRESVARRFGFTALLLGIACVTSLMDALQNHTFSTLRIVFLVITGFLSFFFTRTWWKVRKGSDL